MIDRISDPVLRRLSGIRGRVRQVLWTGGVARTALVTLAAVLTIGLIDWWMTPGCGSCC
ncbi:MAG: hypothetical protein NT069_14615 [Planctomycetota bacterium]|nr:hypothetical protein [Planctomycetota bacterium]